jgi:hypothetical protein
MIRSSPESLSPSKIATAELSPPCRREAATVGTIAVGSQVSTIRRISHRIACSTGIPIIAAM